MRAVTLLLLLALPVFAQPGGDRRGGFGDRGSGRGGFSADDSFNRLLSGYGGSGDVLDYSRVSPESRERYNRFAQFSGSEPMPTSGTITRAQYAEGYAKRMEAMQRGGGFGRGGGGGGFGQPPGGSPGSTPQNSVTVTASQPGSPNAAATVTPQAPPGAPPERQVSDDDVRSMIRRYDRDNDGRISLMEAERTERLKYVFGHYDANKDGIIEESEMRGYVSDRFNNRVPDPNSNGGPPQNYYGGGGYGGGYGGGDYGRDNRGSTPVPEEEKPVVFRFGKLPMKDLPSWFETLDSDKDGQVGLYEWREGKKATNEFVTMDLNADGLLTAEEYLRYRKTSGAGSSDSSSGSSRSGRENGSSRNSNEPRSSGSMSDKERKREEERRKDEEKRREKENRGGDKRGSNGENPFRPK